jgi:hypothetical protein
LCETAQIERLRREDVRTAQAFRIAVGHRRESQSRLSTESVPSQSSAGARGAKSALDWFATLPQHR